MNKRCERRGERARTSDTRGTSKQVVVIGGGGNMNAQFGRNIGAYGKSNTVGIYGFGRTSSQGDDQIEWLTEHGSCQVNSFFYVKKRDIWFNRGYKHVVRLMDSYQEKRRDMEL